MGKQFVTSMCVMCMLCAIHPHCAIHHNAVEATSSHPSQNVTRSSWLYAERLGRGFNSQPLKRVDKTVDPGRLPDPVSSATVDNRVAPASDSDTALESPIDRLSPAVSRVSREVDEHDANQQFYIRAVFDKFGDGNAMSYEGFVRLLKTLKLDRLASAQLGQNGATGIVKDYDSASAVLSSVRDTAQDSNANKQEVTTQQTTHAEVAPSPVECLKALDVFTSLSQREGRFDEAALTHVCPRLLYQLSSVPDTSCFDRPVAQPHSDSHDVHTEEEEVDQTKVWLYSTLSIILISLCGLLGVAVIPIMQHMFYQQMLQFFVALAVGTLCGDALLHLLPHAMSSPHDHSHSATEAGLPSSHDANMWKGVVAALGVVFLFFTEKCLALVSEWRQKHQRKRKVPPRVRVMRDRPMDVVDSATVGEKLCKHKYSSYPYCYDEITTEMTEDKHHPTKSEPEHNHNEPGALVLPSTVAVGNGDGHHHSHSHGPTPLADEDEVDGGPEGGDEEAAKKPKDRYTVILREHENIHHGHSHTHGHVHSPPENMSSVAWMVIMGDGLHNFTDGMAIGAAFAANIAGGFSTAIAVFCHELPHELGDFAVLLKAGMSAKQAVFYNVLSSVLCFFGMVIGVSAGNWDSATQWIFAAAAGMFLYIALVDMIPELSSSHSKEGGSLVQCILQILGLLAGLGVMLAIATYEEDLKHAFTDKN